ncbi:g4689 [Coccomyxa elongata]
MQLDASTPEEVPTSQQEQACKAEGCNFDEASDLNVFEPVKVAFEEEANALGRIIHSLLEYRTHAEWEVRRWQHNYEILPDNHRRLLAHQPAKFVAARSCIDSNDRFFRSMIRSLVMEASQGGWPICRAMELAQQRLAERRPVSPADAEKCRYVLKNLVRDWGPEGAAERAQSYGRIVAELRECFRDRLAEEGTPPPSVLVPGAGLGRLCLDIAKVGFETQGNEFSYYMLLTSSFMLNHCERVQQWTIFPWVLSSCNQPDDAAQLRPVSIPDELPAEVAGAAGLRLSMAAGDFVEVYEGVDQAGRFDCVATCFFIDTAHNIIRYMEVIRHCLKDGGVWINLGPLQYHWADAQTYVEDAELAHSLEIPLEDVERIAEELGFKMLRHEMVLAGFNTNSRCMQVSTYDCVFWTMVLEKG